MKNKFISCLLLILIVLFAVPVQAAEGVINSFYVDSTGTVEIIGYFDDTTQTDTTLLMSNTELTADTSAEIFRESVMYIDQQKKGNNGTFYFHFPLDEKWSESQYVLKMNGGELVTRSGTLRKIPSGIANISNNALRVGNDVYDIGCEGYTSDNIAESLAEGGNQVYYKIGGEWFDMLDEKAINTEYFSLENAVPQSEWDTWEIDTYYHY